MPLFDSQALQDMYGLPVDQILSLPDLLTADLEAAPEALAGRFQERPIDRRPVVHIPGWDEIIHVVPESFLPLDEQDRRRRERAIRIAQSPTPESAQAIASIMTWVDDVQDGLVTAAVLSRLVAAFYKPALPVAALLQEAAAASNIFALTANTPAIALTGKFRANRIIPSLLGAQSAQASRTLRIRQLAPTVGEIIQIAQTTDNLFGVGLSLGPIVGLASDLLFSGLAGGDVAFQSGIRYREGDEIFLRKEDQDRAENLDLHNPLRRVLAPGGAAAWLLAVPDGLSFSDRLDALVLLSLVPELARGFLAESRWEPILLPTLDRDRAASALLRPKTALEIHRLGIDPYTAESYPVPGNPQKLTPRVQAEVLSRIAKESVAKWIQDAPTPESALFANQLAADLPFRMIRAVEGCPCDFKTNAVPIWRAVIDSLELGLTAPAKATRAQLQAYLDEAAAIYEGDLQRPIPVLMLRQLHQKRFNPPAM